MKMSEDERQCLSESRGGSANVISIFSYCARRYYTIPRLCSTYAVATLAESQSEKVCNDPFNPQPAHSAPPPCPKLVIIK